MCLAGSGLRDSLQEVDSIAALPGLEEKMSQISVFVPVITPLSTVLLCLTACSFGINHSSERVSQEKTQTFTQHFGLCSSVLCQTWKRKEAAKKFRVWKKRIL